MRLVINRCNPFMLDRNRIKIRRRGRRGGEEKKEKEEEEEEKKKKLEENKIKRNTCKRCQRDTCVTLVEER